MSIPFYYYDSQIETYLIQFMAIFSLLKVKTGVQGDGEIHTISVPTHYGSKDRVAAAILGDNTQNLPLRLPVMSAYMTELRLSPDRRKGVGVERVKTFVPRGALLPDGAQVIHQYMPIPYDLTIQLSIYSSNLFQRFQILEQILMMFDPDLQIQRTDAEFDWTKITVIQLTDVNFEETYPSGTDRRYIIDNLTFHVPIYITPPAKIRNDYIKEIWVRIGEITNIIHDGEETAHKILNEFNDRGLEYFLNATVEDLNID